MNARELTEVLKENGLWKNIRIYQEPPSWYKQDLGYNNGRFKWFEWSEYTPYEVPHKDGSYREFCPRRKYAGIYIPTSILELLKVNLDTLDSEIDAINKEHKDLCLEYSIYAGVMWVTWHHYLTKEDEHTVSLDMSSNKAAFNNLTSTKAVKKVLKCEFINFK